MSSRKKSLTGTGYVNMDRNTLAANNRLNNPTVQEWCDQVVNGHFMVKNNSYLSGRCALVVPLQGGIKVHCL